MQGGQIVRPRRDMGRCETVQEQTTLDEDFSPGTNVVVGFNGHQLRNSARQPVPGFHSTNSQRFATFCYFWILLNAFQINVNVCFLPPARSLLPRVWQIQLLPSDFVCTLWSVTWKAANRPIHLCVLRAQSWKLYSQLVHAEIHAEIWGF